jgi:hypothetical protein
MTNKKSDRLASSKPHEVKPGHSDDLQGPAPSSAEKQEIALATARQHERRPRVAINIQQGEKGRKATQTHSDGTGWYTRLTDAFGTTSADFVDLELTRLTTVFQDRAGVIDAKAVNAGLALIDGLKPENELEAMLIAQMARYARPRDEIQRPSLQWHDYNNSGAGLDCPNPVSAAAGFHNPNRLAVEHAARWPAEGRGRTRARLPRRSSDRRRRNPCREGDIR